MWHEMLWSEADCDREQEIDPWIQTLKEVSVNSYAETFLDMPHGWMTSR